MVFHSSLFPSLSMTSEYHHDLCPYFCKVGVSYPPQIYTILPLFLFFPKGDLSKHDSKLKTKDRILNDYQVSLTNSKVKRLSVSIIIRNC